MDSDIVIDHLFRHQHGRMVAILTRIFGLSNLEIIEDAVQDTFIRAMGTWRNGMPDNPEAWLTQAAKNRTIDLFRKLKSEKERAAFMENGTSTIAVNEMFLDDEIADSQLRMIFTACHPVLDPRDQIAFALKTIAGFSQKEIASALLLKEETIKKRLSRARQAIQLKSITFEIPQGEQLQKRMIRVLEVLYLLFNEGFHSNKKEIIVRKELCGEAMRLTKMIIDNPVTSSADAQALFALMCFHSARLDSKINDANEIIDLRKQDRSSWYFPLIAAGNKMMYRATAEGHYSIYHYEAAIASEHLRARTFEETDWDSILKWYGLLQQVAPSPFNILNMAVVNLQQEDFTSSKEKLDSISIEKLGQRAYLYYGCRGQLLWKLGNHKEALCQYDLAIESASNESERAYLSSKREQIAKDLSRQR
jgi:RNA polymerase sigma-70 factor (ECF subfamily)